MNYMIVCDDCWLYAEGHKKKKKFRLRNNQTVPYAEAEPTRTSESFKRPESPLEESSYDTLRSRLPQLKLTRSPQLERLHEDIPDGEEDDGLCFCCS